MKWNVVVAGGPYLTYGKVHDYLQSDGRYVTALVPQKDVVAVLASEVTEIPKPNLCIIEWFRDNEHYEAIVILCKKWDIEVLVAVSKAEFQLYLDQKEELQKQFILMPINKDELVARASIQLGITPNPLGAGMIRIDDGLAVNFESRILRRGKNGYDRLSYEETPILRCLYQNINRWVSAKELGESYAGADEISSELIRKKIVHLRKKIDDSMRYPKYILSDNRRHVHMLHSKAHPQVDSIMGFKKTLENLKTGNS